MWGFFFGLVLFCCFFLNLSWIPAAMRRSIDTGARWRKCWCLTNATTAGKGMQALALTECGEGTPASSEKKSGCSGQEGWGREQIAALLLTPERPAKLSLRPEVAASLEPTNPCQAIRRQPEGSQRDLPLTPHIGQLPGSQCHQEMVASLSVLLSFWLKYAPLCFGDVSRAMGKQTLVLCVFQMLFLATAKNKTQSFLKDKQVLKCWWGTLQCTLDEC